MVATLKFFMDTIKLACILILLINLPVNANSDPSSVTDNKIYRDFCCKAVKDSMIFKNFRRHPIYQNVLEHVSYSHGAELLKVIQDKYPNLLNYWDKFSKNDLVGNPVTFKYENGFEISPTTLRYIKILGDIEELFGNMSGKTILEIGGGYGGQCKIICDRFSPKEYVIVDLEEPISLTKKYLSALDITNTNTINLIKVEDAEPKTCDLFISNYAFSECTKKVQDEYLEKYIFQSKAGYMIFNTWDTIPFECYSYANLRDLLIENGFEVHISAEDPSTSSQNLLFIWHKK